MNNEFKKICGRKRSRPNLKYYPGVSLEGLKNTSENLIEGVRSLRSDLKSELPEYEARVILTLR